MKTIKVSAIIQDNDWKFLLQKRDKEPEKGKRVLFGWGWEGDETIEETCRREIEEELNYKIIDMEFFQVYDYEKVKNYIFIVRDIVSWSDLTLQEGEDMGFFSLEAVDSLALWFRTEEMLLDYNTML